MPKSNRNPSSATHSGFSAVLLAGGRSTRMGRDKATLEIKSQPLWQRQLVTLRATGASEIFISGRADGPYADSGVIIIEDLTPGAGPLAALEAVLPRVTHPHLVVLAIDLPEMRSEFLMLLVQTARAMDCSVVPEIGGRFEPLAAVYSPRLLPLVRECLRGADHSMQYLLRKAALNGLLHSHSTRRDEVLLFQNLNSPGDVIGNSG